MQLLQRDPAADEKVVECNTPQGSRMFFIARDSTYGLERHCTAGTPAGTKLLKDISSPASGYPKDLTRLGNKVLFTAFTAATGRELSISDGTGAGTVLLKDIYIQKPLTYSVREGQALVRAVRKHEVILQVGSQQRSDRRFRQACELVRNGRIGKLERVRRLRPGSCYCPNKASTSARSARCSSDTVPLLFINRSNRRRSIPAASDLPSL